MVNVIGDICCCLGVKINVIIVARILNAKYKRINTKIEIQMCSENWNFLFVEF